MFRSLFTEELVRFTYLSKDSKIVFDAALLNTQHYKVRIKGIVERSREWSNTPSYTSM